jgi:hypothetical protein
MRRPPKGPTLALLALGILSWTLMATAEHKGDPHTANIHALGESLRAGGISGIDLRDQGANSDLAFWGKYAIQGRYDGFRIINIAAPGNPKEVTYFQCRGNQGDITVWGHLLIRSINAPMTSDDCGAFNQPSGVAGFEGLQIFDISDIRNPRHITSVATDCGSHTQTVVPDLKNNRLIIYTSTSGTQNLPMSPFGNICTEELGYVDIVAVPLADPAAAQRIGRMELHPSHHCHDIGVILGDVNKALCAGVPENVLLDISDPANPIAEAHFTYVPTRAERDPANPDARELGGWHSAAWTWDGKVMVLGWEPGGGGAPECEASDPDYEKAIYFYARPAPGETPRLLGRWVLRRPQGTLENCTVHNYNVLPIRGRYVLVHGSYQSGTSMVDFTDPANPVEIAWSDPAPLPAQPSGSLTLGGAWSTYYYNNFIYESDITRGLRVYRVSDRVAAGTRRLPHLNPQTQEFTLP